MRLALVALALLAAPVARAELDTFGLGNGQDGSIDLQNGDNLAPSVASRLTQNVAAGASTVVVADTDLFNAGDLVMLARPTGAAGSTATPTNVDLSTTGVGAYELARIAGVNGTTVTLTAPVVQAFPAAGSQLVLVREYTSVRVRTGATLRARAWDGQAGGILAFLVQGTLRNDGTITANAAGFRPGIDVNDSTGPGGCTLLDEAAPRGAQKGEGIMPSRFGATATGRGNAANGGGGGICHNSGGGGGGHGGRGGIGGLAWDNQRVVGGLGGASLTYSLLERLTFGGGGGAGHENNNVGTRGGHGGGAILVRAQQLTGGGTISANGEAAPAPGASSNDGMGGGGAGGAILLRFTGDADCGSVTAAGGNGSSTPSGGHGPGGGGGGGKVLVQRAGGNCAGARIVTTAGAAGLAGGVAYGAEPTPANRTTPTYTPAPEAPPTGGFTTPPTPTILTPAAATLVATARPSVTGTARAGDTVILSVDGVALARVTADAAGNWTWTPGADLADGPHTVSAQAIAVGVASARVDRTFTVDVTPPDTTLTNAPSGLVATRDATLAFSSADGATFECALDGASFAPCTAPTALTGLADGAHAFAVRARDAAGNADPTPATATWSVDATIPETTIDGGPSGTVTTGLASLVFSSTEASATFECSLDGAFFASCTSPMGYRGLFDGVHTFQVRARDIAGNVDLTPATRTWTIDRVPPDTTLAGAPASPTNVTAAVFALSSTEAPPAFECSLDGAAFAPCTSTMALTGLAEGPHVFEARAVDAALNRDPTPARATWLVDLTAPDTSIDAAPPARTTATDATFAVRSNDATATFECALDGAAFAPCATFTYTGLLEGAHALEVRAVDAATNRDPTPARATWTIDLTAPTTAIDEAPPAAAASTTATFSFSSDDPAAAFACALDGADFAPCPAAHELPGLAEGPHELAVRASDDLGNTDQTPATHAWTVDVTAPDTTIETAPPELGNDVDAAFTFTSNEAGVTFECALDSRTFTPCEAATDYAALTEGQHALHVRARDAAGNVDGTPDVRAFVIDLTPPQTSIQRAPPAESASSRATFALASNEPGSTFECALDGAAFAPCNAAHELSGLSDGFHTLRARATDGAGNVDATPAQWSWSVTAVPPPVITAPAEGASTSTRPVFRGTAPANARVRLRLRIDGAELVDVVADASGAWTHQPAGELADGAHRLSATVIDAEARESTPADRNFTVIGDTDGDGLSDTLEATLGTRADAADSDADGLSDFVEANGGSRVDTDQDGTIDALDTDTDNDGLPDAGEGTSDTDTDGTPDFRDTDDDGDGLPTGREALDAQRFGHDVDGDGLANHLDRNADGTGADDGAEGLGDADADGIPNYLDPDDADGPNADADGDGLANGVEARLGTNAYAADTDGDGLGDGEEVGEIDAPRDTDDDGTIDARDEDDDGDGLTTADERSLASADPDGDGTPNWLDTDSDDDTITDAQEGAALVDTDEDGTPDLVDGDTDGDGVSDRAEAGDTDPATAPVDTDDDGTPDFRDLDSDDDGVPDADDACRLQPSPDADCRNPPRIANVAEQRVRAGDRLALRLVASDPDGDELAFSATGLPAGATLSPTTGELAWQTQAADVGRYEVSVTVTDSTTLAASTTVTIVVEEEVVTPPNGAPVIAAVAPITVEVDEPVTVTCAVSDPDGDVVTCAASGLPDGATWDPAALELAWMPVEEGERTITVTCSDGSLEASTDVVVRATPPTGRVVGGCASGLPVGALALLPLVLRRRRRTR